MRDFLPYHVAVMDDDPYSLKWITALLMRDLRTTVCAETETPEELLDEIADASELDAILLDVEYAPPEPLVEDLIANVLERAPQAAVICLSQYGDPRIIRNAVSAGARGFLLKNEVRMAIATAVSLVCKGGLVITPGVEDALQGNVGTPPEEALLLISWQPNPYLPPRVVPSLWLRLYGMSARLAAKEIGLKPGTVERYLGLAYEALPDGRWVDESHLEGIDLTDVSAEDEAFFFFTLPPRKQSR